MGPHDGQVPYNAMYIAGNRAQNIDYHFPHSGIHKDPKAVKELTPVIGDFIVGLI